MKSNIFRVNPLSLAFGNPAPLTKGSLNRVPHSIFSFLTTDSSQHSSCFGFSYIGIGLALDDRMVFCI